MTSSNKVAASLASPDTPMVSVTTGPTLTATRNWIRAASG